MAPDSARDKITNRFLLALPRDIRDQILSHFKPVEFSQGHVIYPVGTPIQHLYFVNRGLISLVAIMRDGRSVQIGAVGNEGFLGVFSFYDEPFGQAIANSVVEIATNALRINRKTFQSEIIRHDALRELVHRYYYLVGCHLVQNAACNRLHSLEQRCCRWLLVARDNALADNFTLTHEFLALLLGAQRPSISMVTGTLRRAGLVHYKHGHVTITDGGGIQERACECYDTARMQIDRLFEPSRR
jgi:CRP-like cAMP-binding protein